MNQQVRVMMAVLIGMAGAGAAAAAGPGGSGCEAAELERNKARARLVFEEILSQGKVDENEHLYHPQFVAHGPNRDAGRDEDRAASKGWRQAVPDLRMDVLRVVAECDLVSVHWSGSGTNTGEGNGLPATGRTLSHLWGMTVFRFDQGQIREEWTVFDQYALLKGLGLLAPAGTATP